MGGRRVIAQCVINAGASEGDLPPPEFLEVLRDPCLFVRSISRSNLHVDENPAVLTVTARHRIDLWWC